MFGIGFTEMVVIGAIALVVIGPEKFPEVAKIFIRTVRDMRGYWEEAKSTLNEELKPVKKEMNSLSQYDPKKYVDKELKFDDIKKKPSWDDEEGTSLREAREAGYYDPDGQIQPGGDEGSDPYADVQDEVAHTVPDDMNDDDVPVDRQEPQPEPYRGATEEDRSVAADELGVEDVDDFDNVIDPADLDDERQ
jgi:Tat protein translocase TatB subunit